MGMYTEVHYNVELKKDTPKEVIEILKYMVGDSLTMPDLWTGTDPLFLTDRWAIMLRCDSYYFSADTHSTLRYDDIGDCYYLCVRSNLKNYDQEIEKFVVWLDPHVEAFSGDFLGFRRYEESEDPIIIRKL